MLLVHMVPLLAESRLRILLWMLSGVGNIEEDLVHRSMPSVEGAACPEHGRHAGDRVEPQSPSLLLMTFLFIINPAFDLLVGYLCQCDARNLIRQAPTLMAFV